jgi:DNA-binding transcriptional ArsR family regulator
VTSAFDATVEPARRRILDLLIEGPRPVGDLVAGAGLSQPNTSRHLRVLREAGLVEVRPDGRRRLYALRPEGLAELERWLAPYRRMWRERLGALEDHLDAKE